MSPDNKKKADRWWARQTSTFPELVSKYGESVPLDESGRIPYGVLTEVQEKKSPTATPREIDWKARGRDVTSGLANIATIPLLGKGQGAIEDWASGMWGVEPRDFDIPDDGGFWRTVADPILPTLAGYGTVTESLFDPISAVVTSEIGKSFEDPYGTQTIEQSLRDQGVGWLAAKQQAAEEIPWYARLPVDILTSPEELIPGWGLYGGLTRAASRKAVRELAEEATEATTREVAEEAVEEVAPTVAREVEEAIEPVQLGLGRPADEFIPREGTQPTLPGMERPQPERLAEDVPVGEVQQGIYPNAQNRIDEIIDNVTDTYDARGMNIIRQGTSPNKTVTTKLRAQNNVRDRFEKLVTGNLNDAQTKRAADYVAKQTGLSSEEVRRLANEAVSEQTYGTRLTRDEQLLSDVVEAIDSNYDRRTQYSPEVESSIDILIGLREEGKHLSANFKPYYGRVRNRAAQEAGITPLELDRHIDELTQGTLVGFDDLPKVELSPDRYAVQLRLPLQFKGSKAKEVEEVIATRKNQGYPMSGVRAVTEFGQRVQDRLLNVSNGVESALRALITPDEQAHILDKNTGLELEDILSVGEAKTRVGKQLVVKYEGTINERMSHIEEDLIDGNKLLEDVGLGRRETGLRYGPERAFVINDIDWGTQDRPGPLKFLFRALHGEVRGMDYSAETVALARDMWITGRNLPESTLAHPTMSAANQSKREEIFNTLKEITMSEEASRVDFDQRIWALGQDFDPNRNGFGFIKREYFYRGMKPIKGLSDDTIKRNVEARLGQRPSVSKARTSALYWELEDMGFETLFRNPFEQAAQSQQQGIKFRLQQELVEYLKDPRINLAQPVSDIDDEPLRVLKTKYGVTYRVPQIGPAFEGKTRIIEEAGEVKKVVKDGQYAVPAPVADTLESIFRGGATSINKVMTLPGGREVNVAKLIDAMVFIPKRIKLFASMFQVSDFSRRLGIGSVHAIVEDFYANITKGMSSKEAFDSAERVGHGFRSHIGAMGKGWADMWGGYFQAGRSAHYRTLLKSRKTTGAEAVIEGGGRQGDIHWSGFVRNGLNVRDLTLLPPEDLANLVDEVASTTNLPTRLLRQFKELEYSSRRGLFNRVYPAAIMTDVKYNLLPVAMRTYPKATDEQLMALVSRQANLKYSTLLRSQSKVNQFWREVLTRTAFSLNENEGLLRQLFNAFVGTERGFWQRYWLSAGIFFTAAANAIHMATVLVSDEEAEGPLGLPLLPTDRYIPIYSKEKGFPIGYKSSTLAPSLPIETRSGEKAMIDMLGQMDTAGRLLEPVQFIQSRMSTPVGALRNLFTASDFYGRETDEFGHVGRVVQFAYDMGTPIGLGQLAVGSIADIAGGVHLPEIGGGIIHPDTTLKDVIPVTEQSLGMTGLVLQASGENIRAPGKVDIEKTMIRNTFPNSDVTRLHDLDAPERLEVERDAKNFDLVKELADRSVERAEQDDAWYEQKEERKELKASRVAEQSDIYERLMNPDKLSAQGMVWEPTKIRKAISDASFKYRIRMDGISTKYEDEFLEIKQYADEWENPSEERLAEMKAKTPVTWARHRWITLMKKHSDEFQNMDWKAFEADFDRERATWGDELVERFDAHYVASREDNHHDEILKYYNAMDKLDEVGWWDLEAVNAEVERYTALLSPKGGVSFIDEYIRWRDGGSQTKMTIERTSPFASAIKRLKQVKSNARNQLLGSHPNGKEIDRILIRWYGRVPSRYHRDNIQYYSNLYGRLPTRLN